MILGIVMLIVYLAIGMFVKAGFPGRDGYWADYFSIKNSYDNIFLITWPFWVLFGLIVAVFLWAFSSKNSPSA